ncbi:MAG: hypothetical protein ACI8QC_004229 [Planctomycetota bacterium]|jgi:hypothetical protein
MKQLSRLALAGVLSVVSAPSATADISAWLAAVAAGSPASYVNSALVGPLVDDVGSINSAAGVTYEVIVNGTNAGLSSALIGARGTGVGDSAGFKFEQYADTMQYGLTEFGIVDRQWSGGNLENVDVHLAFVVDTTAGGTELFVDGISVGVLASAPVLQGMVGFGQIHDPNTGPFDILTGAIHGVAVYESMLSLTEILAHRDAYLAGGSLGTVYCSPAPINSSGGSGVITATGSDVASGNSLTLTGSNLPDGQFAYFLASRTQGLVTNPGGSQGNLCVLGTIAHLRAQVGQVSNTEFSIVVDLTNMPEPPNFGVTVLAGETWNFQCWHRDIVNGSSTSNFTSAVSVLFQ